jgi:hypothetical protein
VRDERECMDWRLEGKCAFVEFTGWEWLKKVTAFDPVSTRPYGLQGDLK